MTINQQYQQLRQQLETLYSTGEAEAIAHWVLEHYTGLGRMAIKMNRQRTLSLHEKQLIDKAAKQLLGHMPVQYVLGEAWFKGMAFFVNGNVLIPRPETEELVNWVIATEGNLPKQPAILDIGTGSGCIAIAIKKAIPLITVTAIDVSEGALQVARRNADKLSAEVALLQMDFLQPTEIERLGKYDLIISNPPYIPANEKAKLDQNVSDFEPATALFVPDHDPLLFYRKIAEFGKTHLEAEGNVFMECHQDFASATRDLFQAKGYTVELKKDMFDNERMLRAWL